MIIYKGKQIPRTLEEIVNPKHTAVLVHEMLNDWVTPGGVDPKTSGKVLEIREWAAEVLPPMVKLVETARKRDARVMYACFTKYADNSQLNDPQISRTYQTLMDPNNKPNCVEGTWGHQIRAEVAPQEGDIVVNKFKTDAFFQTNLDLMLRLNGIRTFIIVGYGAEVGGVPTVTHGNHLGYFTVVARDCISAVRPENYDDAMLVLERYAIMTTSSEICKAWGS